MGFFGPSQGFELAVEYVIREHHAGRALSEILADDYVTSRCSPEQIDALIDDPRIIAGVSADVLAELRPDADGATAS
jgi:hypothetical protein